MPLSNALKLVLHWSGYGEEGTLQWYFNGAPSMYSPAQLQAAAGAAVSAWNTVRTPSSKTQLTAMLTTLQSVDKVTLYQYATLPGPVTELGVTAPGWTGSAANMVAPLQVAQVASLRTATAGASYRGRMYFPGHCQTITSSTALVANAQIDTVGQLAANMGPEAAQAMETSLSISQLDWSVYSPKRGLMTKITAVAMDNKLDTQRRRERNLKATYHQTYSV